MSENGSNRNGPKSSAYFGGDSMGGMLHRAFTKSMGFDDEDFKRPTIGICNTFSEVNNCNSHLRELAEAVKRGVWQAGGFPMEFPTISLGEVYINPTTMLYRNLAAMDTEEMIRSQPLDGIVLLTGCDKTTPAALMGAISANMPSLMLSGGPMLNGNWRGQMLGACTDCRRMSDEYRAGNLTKAQYKEIEDGLIRSRGHCMVMGTASTMNSLMEGLGMALPGNGAIPAVDSRRLRLAEAAGRRIVGMVEEDLRPAQILTRQALENAITLLCALGGSTNAVVHLPAFAGRLGIELPLEIFDEISRRTPLIANMRPSGQYQMEDLYYAGGIPAVLKQLLPLLHGDVLTVTGRTMAENVQDAEIINPDVVRTLDDPLQPEGGIVILRGNLAPDGAVIKQSAVSPHLRSHRGRAVVFQSVDDFYARFNDPDLDVNAEDVLVLQNAGPVGGPGMAEVGNMPLPDKILKQGVRDMLRISDARMSGTAYGAVVLHVAPESAVGGPLGLVENGDEVELDIDNRRLHLHVTEEELARRREAWQPPQSDIDRGYTRLYTQHVMQAPQGCDFDFLRNTKPVKATETTKV